MEQSKKQAEEELRAQPKFYNDQLGENAATETNQSYDNQSSRSTAQRTKSRQK